MVDYSKFANIDVDSSSQSDDATGSTHETFQYPLGVEDPQMRLFDIRDEACRPHGFRHGDVVVTEGGEVCTVIGVHGTSLYFHKEGSPGAGTFSKSVPLKAIARTTVRAGHQSDPPSVKSEWLKLDFSYARGLREVTIERFDIRDHICKQVGGFTHGQVVQVQGMKPMVAVGVRRGGDGRLLLWFHLRGARGAGTCSIDDMKRATVTGTEVVRQVTEVHECPESGEHGTFSFPLGRVNPHLELFDIRPEACKRFGYQHGDVVITDNGVPSTVIGVHDDTLWFHMEGSPGAGIWPPDEHLKVIAHTEVSAEQAKRGPNPSADWLRLDFRYKCGLRDPEIEAFDTRDSICLKVGGFKHGQVVQVPGISKTSVTIGVRRSADGRVLLWFRVKGLPGAGVFSPEDLKNARVVGDQVVRQMGSASAPPVRERPVPPFPNDREEPPSPECAQCLYLMEQLRSERQDREQLLSEKKALEKEVARLRKLVSEKSESRELEQMRKKLAQLRVSNSDLMKSMSRNSEQAERKDRLKREAAERKERLMREAAERKDRLTVRLARENIQQEVKQELEAETREHLMKNLIQPKLDSIEETLKQRKRDAQELKRLEGEVARQAAEKAVLAKRLSEQPLRSDEETWQFLGRSGVWKPYPEAASSQIMEAFMNGSNTCRVTCEGTEYEIDFKLLHQMNCQTEKRRRVRCFFGLPPHWLMSEEDATRRLRGEQQESQEGGSGCSFSQSATMLTTISEATRVGMRADFKQYATKITDRRRLDQFEVLMQKCITCHDGTVCPCHRDPVFRVREAYQVQNLYLWRRYQRCCKTIRDKQKQYNIVPEAIQPPVPKALEEFAQQLQVNTDRNERLLFHGTKSIGYAKAIAAEGFDNRVAQRGLYGQGTYFASLTCKSAQYGTPGGQKASHRKVGTMILSRVALGDPFYATGGYQEARPPTKKSRVPNVESRVPNVDSDDEDERDVLCDSVIARPGTLRNGSGQLHAEFVTFSPEQAYPEFILRYIEEE